MERMFFDRDPLTGATQYFYHDEDTDESIIETVFDAEPLLGLNKASFNSIDERARWGDGKLVARIPGPLFYQLKAKGIVDDERAFKAWLNDSDNRFFRTRPGRV